MAEVVNDLRRWAQETPQRPAIVSPTARLTYGELDALANRIAQVFKAEGLQRGEHIASLMGNGPEALAIAWAAYRSGLYLTPLPTTLAVPEAAAMVAGCDAKCVIVDARWRAIAAPLATQPVMSARFLSLGGAIQGYRPLEPLLASASPLPRDDESPGALMVFTSGTTGAPRGVWRPLPSADYRGTPPFASDLLALFNLGGPQVRYLSTAPLYHAAPLRFALAVTSGGGTVHLMDRFDAESALSLIESESITHSQWVPTMFQRLLELPGKRRSAFRAPSHRVAIHGAAPCPTGVKRAMIDWWGPILLEYYSGSEGVGLTLIDSLEALRKPGSVGRARKGVAHILDAEARELPAGETGVVYFSGIAPFAYYKDPAKTAAKTSPQGWQTFGDVGHLDADGCLFLTDRLDDMIISGGVNVYPQEIERAILEVPGVWDCAVVGVPDERFGERPVAFVVPARDDADDPAALVERIRAHNQAQLGRLKQPAEIRIIDALPRTPTGKVLRRVLRDGFNDPSRQGRGA
jgi:long-chain acyl-CoA synthetase